MSWGFHSLLEYDNLKICGNCPVMMNIALVLNVRHPIMEKFGPCCLLAWAPSILNSLLPLHECLLYGPLD
jgi:hypothetical protein